MSELQIDIRIGLSIHAVLRQPLDHRRNAKYRATVIPKRSRTPPQISPQGSPVPDTIYLSVYCRYDNNAVVLRTRRVVVSRSPCHINSQPVQLRSRFHPPQLTSHRICTPDYRQPEEVSEQDIEEWRRKQVESNLRMSHQTFCAYRSCLDASRGQRQENARVYNVISARDNPVLQTNDKAGGVMLRDVGRCRLYGPLLYHDTRITHRASRLRPPVWHIRAALLLSPV